MQSDAVVPFYLLGLGQLQMHLGFVLHESTERALERWGDGYSAPVSNHIWNSPLQLQVHKNSSVFQEWCSMRHSQWSSQCSCPGDGFKELQRGTERTSINPSLSCWHFLNLRDTQEHRWPLDPGKTTSKWVCNLLDACTPSRISTVPLASLHGLPLQPFSTLLSFNTQATWEHRWPFQSSHTQQHVRSLWPLCFISGTHLPKDRLRIIVCAAPSQLPTWNLLLQHNSLVLFFFFFLSICCWQLLEIGHCTDLALQSQFLLRKRLSEVCES